LHSLPGSFGLRAIISRWTSLYEAFAIDRFQAIPGVESLLTMKVLKREPGSLTSDGSEARIGTAH
jgi:hypothetical protein